MRLSSATVEKVAPSVRRPLYDRDAQEIGIVHFGIGAFHRAHQALYTDDAMGSGDRDWSIVGVSLRSPDVAARLNPQNGLYTVTERSVAGNATRLIGAVKNALVADRERGAVIDALAAPPTRIVSFTITEKGYCRAPGGSLDFALAERGSIYPLLRQAFARRQSSGLAGLTLLSCDNLSGNGAQLARLIAEYLRQRGPNLARWFETECACPSAMVDRIVPATSDADRDKIEAAIGMRDEAAIVTEPFSQWVIEDRFAGPRPRWEAADAVIASDVRPYEIAKLRMLNGAHSALAYLGLARGHQFVHQAIADPALKPLIDRLMRAEAAPSLTPAPGQDLAAYADALIERFRNPALNHRLAQIAMDGSQKIPQRWLETLAHHQNADRECPVLVKAVAAWLLHVRGDNGAVDDPSAEDLKSTWKTAGEFGIVDAVFGQGGAVRSRWRPTDADRTAIVEFLRANAT